MIDFASTRTTTPEELKGHYNFLTWFITERILLAATPSSQEERKAGVNTDPDGRLGIEYLFGQESSAFELHAELIGSSATAIRNALLSDVPLKPGRFTDAHRRAIRIRHLWLKREQRAAADAAARVITTLKGT